MDAINHKQTWHRNLVDTIVRFAKENQVAIKDIDEFVAGIAEVQKRCVSKEYIIAEVHKAMSTWDMDIKSPIAEAQELWIAEHLDSLQAKRREIVRSIVAFAEQRGAEIDWQAAIRYILKGEYDKTQPIVRCADER